MKTCCKMKIALLQKHMAKLGLSFVYCVWVGLGLGFFFQLYWGFFVFVSSFWRTQWKQLINFCVQSHTLFENPKYVWQGSVSLQICITETHLSMYAHIHTHPREIVSACKIYLIWIWVIVHSHFKVLSKVLLLNAHFLFNFLTLL